jgi:uncharacterized SAM-binding protein YcdF (DUF218 family)
MKGWPWLLPVIIVCGTWVLAAPLLAKYLVVERPLEYADAIIVLSGSAEYKERTQKAAELYKKGVASVVFITDDGERSGWSESGQRHPPYVELEQRELISNGVSPDAIRILPGQVTGTNYEAREMAAEIDSRPISSVLIVTSAYHSRRALWSFEKTLAGKDVQIGIVHADIDEQGTSPEWWWLSPRGWRDVAGEYVKSAVYCFYF